MKRILKQLIVWCTVEPSLDDLKRQLGTRKRYHILAVEPPRAQPVDADPGHLVAVRVQCSQYASGRNARDAVLRTRTPVDDPHPDP